VTDEDSHAVCSSNSGWNGKSGDRCSLQQIITQVWRRLFGALSLLASQETHSRDKLNTLHEALGVGCAHAQETAWLVSCVWKRKAGAHQFSSDHLCFGPPSTTCMLQCKPGQGCQPRCKQGKLQQQSHGRSAVHAAPMSMSWSRSWHLYACRECGDVFSCEKCTFAPCSSTSAPALHCDQCLDAASMAAFTKSVPQQVIRVRGRCRAVQSMRTARLLTHAI